MLSAKSDLSPVGGYGGDSDLLAYPNGSQPYCQVSRLDSDLSPIEKQSQELSGV